MSKPFREQSDEYKRGYCDGMKAGAEEAFTQALIALAKKRSSSLSALDEVNAEMRPRG
jgi:hypothetical protein